MTQTRKKARKTKNIRTWIRERTSPYDIGVKTKAGKPAHCNKNDDIKFHFQRLKMAWYGGRLSRLRNADLNEHFAGKKTFYFTADGRSSIEEVLINIDIDCHGSGTLAGAIAFAEHLKKTRFPNLYFEVSTNGNGVHGYVVVEKGDLGDEGLNGALVVLDRWLKAELARGKFDVENVEVKGQAPEFTWGQTKCELKTYKSGQLAKLPREALTRADELRGTTKVSVSELRKLPVPADESKASVVSQGKTAAKKKSVVSVSESENWEQVTPVVSEKVKKTKIGSIDGHHFGPEELTKLGTGYLSLARELIGETRLVATGRKVVTEEDVAVFLMVLRFFSNNMNADGSLPVARWREMWSALFRAGDVQRAWCHHRFARIRNFLTSEGWLSWQEESFVVGVLDVDGRYVPGKASRWKAGEELMKKLEAVDVREVQAPEIVSLKEKEDEKNTLYGNNRLHHDNEQDEAQQNDPLGPGETSDNPPTTPDPRQPTSFDDLLDSLGLWVPVPRPRFAGFSTGQYRMAA